MLNNNKNMEKLDQVLKNMPKPSLDNHKKSEIKHIILARQKGSFQYKKAVAIIGSIAALVIFSLLTYLTINKNQSAHFSSSEFRSDVFVDNIIAQDGSEYLFEQIPWHTTKSELIKNGHLPPTSESDIYIEEENNWEEIRTKYTVTFQDLDVEAVVNYRFFYDLFVGGEYIIKVDDKEQLSIIIEQIKNQIEDKFPALTEEGSTTENNRLEGFSWWSGEDNIDYSSVNVSPSEIDNQLYLLISVKASTTETESFIEK